MQYCSFFNCIEHCFRSLKRNLYSKLFNTQEEIANETINFLKNRDLKLTLSNNYRETLQQYLLYVNNYKDTNLNNLLIE